MQKCNRGLKTMYISNSIYTFRHLVLLWKLKICTSVHLSINTSLGI